VFILKAVKVVCFDTVLQVFILKELKCTRIVQNGSILWVLLPKDFGEEASENEQGEELEIANGKCLGGSRIGVPSSNKMIV
jgi:hypothetical protein